MVSRRMTRRDALRIMGVGAAGLTSLAAFGGKARADDASDYVDADNWVAPLQQLEYLGLRDGTEPQVPFPDASFPYDQAGITPIDGNWTPWRPGYLTGEYCLFGRGQYVTLVGAGYLRCRWEMEVWKGTGEVGLPTIQGDIVPIGEGGEQLLSMGGGANAMPPYSYSSPDIGWINKWYYMDGTCAFVCNERTGGRQAYYNIAVAAKNPGNPDQLYDRAAALRDIRYPYDGSVPWAW